MAKKKSKQNKKTGKVFGEVKGDMRLLRRIWLRRLKGASFQQLEKEFNLKTSSGMVAYRCNKYYGALRRAAEKKVKQVLEPIAGPGEVVIDDSEPGQRAAETPPVPTTQLSTLRSEFHIRVALGGAMPTNYRSNWPMESDPVPADLEGQLRSILDDSLELVFEAALHLGLVDFAKSEVLPILNEDDKPNAEKLLEGKG